MQITSKGQVTIPLNIRKKFGLLPYTEVEFIENKGKVYIRLIATESGAKSRGRSLIAHMRGAATVKMTTEEIMRLTRDEK